MTLDRGPGFRLSSVTYPEFPLSTEHSNCDGGHAAGGDQPQSALGLTHSATLHCLTGCAIGEFAGLAIGTTLGLGVWPTVSLAVVLGFISGFTLSLIPLTRRGLSLGQAFRAIWLGETVSIAVMELAMNLADYHVGGLTAGSLANPVFWLGYGAALVAGYLAAFPVNFVLLKKQLKHCH